MTKNKKTIYLANNFGFAETTQRELERIKCLLSKNYIVLEPFYESRDIVDRYMPLIQREKNIDRVKELYRKMSLEIGKRNVELMNISDYMVAILDGDLIDEGVASEIGYFYSLERPIYALKTDFRIAGDNIGVLVNLQVQYFIEDSGGRIFESVGALIAFMNILALKKC